MQRLVSLFAAQPFKSFQVRMFLYLIIIGSVPVCIALTFFYVQSAERTEAEWKAAVSAKHDRVTRQLEKEMRELEYVYRSLLETPGLELWLKSGKSGLEEEDAAMRRVKESIVHSASYRLEYRKHIIDFCFAIEEGSSFCAAGSPFDYESRASRMPVNRSDFFVREEGRNRMSWVGPLYGSDYYVDGSIRILADMTRILDEMRGDSGLSNLALWDPDTGSVLFESGTRQPGTEQGTSLFLSEKDAFLRAGPDVIVSQRPLSVPGQTWMSYVEVPNTDGMALKSTMRNTVIVFFTIVLAVSIVSSVLFSALFSRPLHSLRRLMKRAESGDLKAYWTSGSVREIDELGNSYNQMLNRLEETIKQAKLEESLKKEAEIEALQYQLNPHFLYNTLNTIKWVAKIHKTPQISDAVSALVRLLQASLGKKGDFLTLKEEIALLRDYMAIQSFRYGDLVKLNLDVDPLASVCLVPKLMLQPLVENALIHGLANSPREGEITIRAWLDRDMLLCQVQDNGIGIAEPDGVVNPQHNPASSKERMSGIGLRNIRERIKLYYGPDYKMHVFSKLNVGTTVRLSLPIHRNEES
ncbi:sensor histidine kinase [Paenibacillus sp. GCM10012303]|jgi:sensor histidine kinase YesM|uniref:sensor histidine kinase n=1 Tax=Paenibacillus sp. GCM10012303 TaxID=3317340 RepID=UPI00361055B1